MPLAQSPKAVQAAALVVILQELHEAWRVEGIRIELEPKSFPRPSLWASPELSKDLRHSLWYMEKDRNWFRNF